MESNFTKVYFLKQLTTKLNTEGVEHKIIKGLFPIGYNEENYETNRDRKFGYAVKTGKASNITVLDCDTMDAYKSLCEAYPKLHQHYTVKSRRGYHVYFIYDPKIKSCKLDKIDCQNDQKLIMGINTTAQRYNDETYTYQYIGGNLLHMPTQIKSLCVIEGEGNDDTISNFVIDKNIIYEVTDEAITEILNKIQINHEDYFLNYELWLKMTTVMKTINKFNIWDKFNKQYSNYSYDKNKEIWNSIKQSISPNFFCKLLKKKFFKFYKSNDELKKLNNNKDAIQVNQQYVNISHNAFFENDTIIIQSKTGTGKTTCVSKLVDFYLKMNPQHSLLSVVNLITLADQQEQTFRKSGVSMTNYQNCKNESILMCDNSVICINSLIMLAECNFENKVVYIDEVRALINTITHNKTLQNCRLIFATLLKIIKTCAKLIITDAHIEKSVANLIEQRKGKITHYNNSHNKFQDIPAIELNSEKEFYSLLEQRIINNELFSFASDTCKTITEWYNKLYSIASPEVQERMILYTGETKKEFCEDWSNKFIFYSPKITCGVDINCFGEHSVQFLYMKGKSVDSVSLYQMATRTRHMEKLYFYSCASCCKSQYESLEDCRKQQMEYFSHNKLSMSVEYMNAIKDVNEIAFFDIYTQNEYTNDLLKTNIKHYFIEELLNAGFIVSQYGEQETLTKDVKDEMEAITQQQIEINVEELCVALDEDTTDISDNIEVMFSRSEYLKVDSRELVEKYSKFIYDKSMYEHFINFKKLSVSEEKCNEKLKELYNNKFITGIHTNTWNKIKYIHVLKNICNLKDVFDIENINITASSLDEEAIKNITMIKKLYQKRDAKLITSYTTLDFHKLYCSMLTNIIGNLKLLDGKKHRSGVNKNKMSYSINQEQMEFIQELEAVSTYTPHVDDDMEDIMVMDEEELIE